MNLQEKVKILLSYCGKYLGHQSMIFERLESFSFNIKFEEETYIEKNLHKLNIIILTGEAGDGKSHLMNNLNDAISEGWEKYYDYSAMTKDSQKKLLLEISNTIKGNNTKKYMIAANMGAFLKSIFENSPDLLPALHNKDSIAIINFEKRNIAKDFDFFKRFIQEFIAYEGECQETSCVRWGACPYKQSIQSLNKDNLIHSLQVLCNAVFLMGGHLTIREMLSLVAFMATNGKHCKDIQEESIDNPISYYNIFDDEEDVLLKKFFYLDPAKTRIEKEYSQMTKSELIIKKRESFFEGAKTIDKLALLPPLFLSEFQSFLTMLQKDEGYIDMKQENELCKNLKYGLLKIISKESSFGEIVLQDSPTYLGEKIKMQFSADFSKISLFWTHINFDIKNPEAEIDKDPFLENKLHLSCFYDEDKTINLLVDYNSFRYIMMTNEDYYMFSETYAPQAYGFSDFFIKILKRNPSFYRKMTVLFDKDMLNENLDFELELYKTPLKKEEKILLKKKDR